MDVSDKSFPSLLSLLKAWLPWRTEPANVSRDFWMPDHSCRVCYECDSQFTLFNRRHHCRHCGRIFCARCTSNWVPAASNNRRTPQEEWEKIRVCNYCFKQWEQGLTADNGVQIINLDVSTSPSATSFISSKSSVTFNSSSITAASMPQSDAVSPKEYAVRETVVDRQPVGEAGTCNGHDRETVFPDSSPTGYVPGLDRNIEDDNEELEAYQYDNCWHYPHVNDYYDHTLFDEVDNEFGSCKVHPDADSFDTKTVDSSALYNSFASEGDQILEKEVANNTNDECEASSSLYAAQDVDAEPVDFENNGLLWLPPEPENEEDEHEALLFDDEEDGNASGEWGYLRTSSSFGSGEQRSKDKSNEEHKKVMKSVVDGHFRALVAQLLEVENLPIGEENDAESWLEIITSLCWEAATLLKPDMSKGGGMDPGGYVKVKCLAAGLRSESKVIKGVVCKKNVAHRRMTSKIDKPRILILSGALEYQRVSNLLSSFDTLLQQEMDHLKMAVAKIDSHHPDVLLVEKSVSRYAQEYLLAKNISLVLNIKRPLLERIARCTGCQMVPSIDHLSSQKLGYCEMFHVDRFIEEHGAAGQGKKMVKTLMYFEGCPKPLGCTILLRGAHEDELKKVKHVIQYGIFAAYHLAVETSFLADEGASLPELPLNSPITVALPDKPSAIYRSISTVPGYDVPFRDQTLGLQPGGEPQRSISLPIPKPEVTELSIPKIEIEEEPCLSAPATSLSFDQTGISSDQLLLSSVDESFLAFVDGGDGAPDQPNVPNLRLPDKISCFSEVSTSTDFNTPSDTFSDCLTFNTMNDTHETDAEPVNTGRPCLEVEVEAKQFSEELSEPASLKEEFPPSPADHQSIVVSLSSRCIWKGTVCERSHLFRIKYYGNFDKPLGRFLRDHLFDQSYRCRSCEMPSEAHVQCYTHLQGTLTISVKKLPEFLLPGEKEGKIWMWHRCLRCPRINGFPPATRRIVMSDAAWGLSFGKFLELSFSNHAAASRVASCGHSLHRDCLRFYGFGKMVACFRYASIDVHSVFLPPPKLDFNYENQEWIQKEVNEVIGRAELLFSEVLIALSHLEEKSLGSSIPCGGNTVIESRRQVSDLEDMLQKEKAEFADSLQKVLSKEPRKGQPIVDILEINRLCRQLLIQSYVWDQRLINLATVLKKNLEIDAALSNSIPVDKSHDDTTDSDLTIAGCQNSDGSGSVSVTQPSKSPCRGASESEKNPRELDQGSDYTSDSFKSSPMHSTGTHIVHDESDSAQSKMTMRRSLSDGQFPIVDSLSDSLDAAWTGDNLQAIGILKDNLLGVSDTASVDSSVCAAVAEKMDRETELEDLNSSKVIPSSVSSSKGSYHMEDSVSWLSLPFMVFYNSLNKNIAGNSQKLDTLIEYTPVYISSFRSSEMQGGARLLLHVGVNDTVIPVYDNEPTSIIAFALVSPEYLAQLPDDLEKLKDAADSTTTPQSIDLCNSKSFNPTDEVSLESYKSFGSVDESVLSMSSSRTSLALDPVSYTKALHIHASFFAGNGPHGKAKYTLTAYYAKQFEALRRICCPSELDFIRSLSRCKKWGAQGGKSNVFFAKTLDDRFIIKQVTKTELESFIKFAPAYFKYLSESIGSGSPTCLAKILGIYQVTSKHTKGGKESKMDVLVMENLLFGRNLTRLYDLKGSSRSRYNPDKSGTNKVLLDQNLIEAMPTSPIFVRNKAKRLLERAVWNDTSFLASVDVMDYSLLVGIDEEKHELVLGIIDFMRQYTWDKHLETWVKASGILGGPKNSSPTVISPKQYKKRFRKAMTTYFLMVPDQWSQPTIAPSISQNELSEENSQAGESQQNDTV